MLICIGVNVMACIDQHQFCNPNNNRCTNFTSPSTVSDEVQSIGLNSVQSWIATRFVYQIYYSTLYSTIAGRGVSALRAQEHVQDLESDPLPDDQWMIEVKSWFDTGLARLQNYMVEYAAGPQNLIEGAYVLKLNHSDAQSLCRNQKVRSTGSNTINFSVLGLALVLIICSSLIITNLALETIVGFIQRKYKTGTYRRLQWIIDEKLQLQRMAFEEAGMGTWSGGDAAVPVTRLGEKFGLPRYTDRSHPRLLPDYLKVRGSAGGGGGGGYRGGYGGAGAGEEIELAGLIRHETDSSEATTTTMTQHEIWSLGWV